MIDETVESSRFRRALRLVGWNALLLVLGAALVAMAGEAWFRLTMPFVTSSDPREFVPNVGLLRPPNTEVRSTDRSDFWNVSRTNSLGFLDREPPSPEHAAATCHISIIGDSFVEGNEVPIHDKFQVRLEELAARHLPYLNITTSAFGIGGTGQVQQLPFYDEYARLLHPKLLVLVFVANDFVNNTPALRALKRRGRRGKILEPMVGRRSDGKLELAWSRPRDRVPRFRDRFPWSPRPQASCADCAMKKEATLSLLARWLHDKKKVLFPSDHDRHKFHRFVEALRRQPRYAALLEGWRPTKWEDIYEAFARRDLPPFFEDGQYTFFALEQFKQRADRDGVKLVILASHTLKVLGTLMFERLSQMAASLDIPVIDQADFVLRQGARLTDAHWLHDFHWNPAGHRWAAEALLEYIEEHPAICADDGRPMEGNSERLPRSS